MWGAKEKTHEQISKFHVLISTVKIVKWEGVIEKDWGKRIPLRGRWPENTFWNGDNEVSS